LVSFHQLNRDWNAEPNAPNPLVEVRGDTVSVSFRIDLSSPDVGCLTFKRCSAWRLGLVNDEGWYAGQCRYSAFATKWGEFYEISDEGLLRDVPQDWVRLSPTLKGPRHFLFYFRDDTFEALAKDWAFSKVRRRI
jgi:hypothetical protein